MGGLTSGTSYRAEAAYRDIGIVIRYDETGLVLRAADAEDGREICYGDLADIGMATG